MTALPDPMVKTILLAVAAALLLGACGPKPDDAAQSGAGASDASDASNASNASNAAGLAAATQLYAGALEAITTRAVFAPADPVRVTGETLNAYLASRDTYSGFLTRDEYAKYRALGDAPYGGVGMELARRRNGDTLCYPYPLGPAGKAGIQTGDRLISIDGASVRGKPLALLAALVTGREGTQVELVVAGSNGLARRMSIERARVDEPNVTEYTAGALHVLKIASFTLGTRSQIELALSRQASGQPLVVDLRGCGGGNFFGALDTAMLFLKKDMPIVTVTGRDGAHLYASTLKTNPPPRTVFVWQDANTASAAEVLIGALTDNGLAVSIGTLSAGKGTRQDIIELQDGSALILTTGYLSTPRGFAFNGRGLVPMRALPADADTAAYARATLPSE
jgi:carboxyl-terminal processing protease